MISPSAIYESEMLKDEIDKDIRFNNNNNKGENMMEHQG